MTTEPQSYASTPFNLPPQESSRPLASEKQGVASHPPIPDRAGTRSFPAGQDSFSLTPRERQILELVWEGLNTREIGDALNVSAKTVEVHRAKIMKKLHARNTAEMIKLSIESGLIVLQDTF